MTYSDTCVLVAKAMEIYKPAPEIKSNSEYFCGCYTLADGKTYFSETESEFFTTYEHLGLLLDWLYENNYGIEFKRYSIEEQYLAVITTPIDEWEARDKSLIVAAVKAVGKMLEEK